MKVIELETSAFGVKGKFIWDQESGRYFLRIKYSYGHRDYTLCAEDIDVTIESKQLSLYEDVEKQERKVSWSSNAIVKTE